MTGPSGPGPVGTGSAAGAAGSAAEWTLPGRFGSERWHREGGRFAAVAVAGDAIGLPTDRLTEARLGSRDTACAHPGPYPLAFRFCPDCGTQLAGAPDEPAVESWSPPFGAPNGLPCCDDPREPDPASGEEIAVPPSPALGFVVAGTPPMLLCCDRVGGWIRGWSERARGWIDRVQLPPCTVLPAWSWAAAADGSGVSLPTDRGPAWVALTAPRRTPVTLLEGFPPLGGAGLMRSHAAVPVRNGNGVALAVLDRAAPERGWLLVSVPTPDAPAGAAFASPVGTGDRLCWCGPDGLLTLSDTATGPVAHWLGWRDGIRPLPGVRPVAEPNGSLHQLARLDPHTLVLEGLPAPGQAPERRVARGYTPGTGRSVFRENARLRLPWDERAAWDYAIPDGTFLLPLLELPGGRTVLALCSGRDRLGRFLGDPAAGVAKDGVAEDGAAEDGAEPDHLCTLFYSRGPRMLEPLECLLRARAASDLSVFLHAGFLYAHGAPDNRCHRWRLRDAR